MLDIDNFKKYNDRYGHYEGDKALKRVAITIKKNTNRANDFAFRLGGEEFAIITSNLSSKKIFEYAEKIRVSIINQKILHTDNGDVGVLSISIGIFNFQSEDNLLVKKFINLQIMLCMKLRIQEETKLFFIMKILYIQFY
ncbi:MAG: diguanylate cyclase [Candidatus Paceibacteria bacterium]